MRKESGSSDRQSLQSLAMNTRADPLHRQAAIVRLHQCSAKAMHDKCMQILREAS